MTRRGRELGDTIDVMGEKEGLEWSLGRLQRKHSIWKIGS